MGGAEIAWALGVLVGFVQLEDGLADPGRDAEDIEAVGKVPPRDEGKAAVKSRRTHAPWGWLREVVIQATSRSNKFARMERCGKKPCCRGKIHFSKCVSHLYRAELAMMRLSQFTMDNGRVRSAV